MNVKARRAYLPDFDARSIALFAGLAVGTALVGFGSAHAQPSATNQPSTALSTPLSQRDASIPPNVSRWTTAQISEAFKRIDSNGDGLISRAEAAQFPGVARHFDAADTNKDGALSRSEFEDAMKQAS